MRTAVVILNWNTKAYLRDFLPGLLASCRKVGKTAEGEEQACVVVADNASSDGSLEMLETEFPEVRTISLDSNYGFTGGYNRALARIDAEYFVLVNSDIDVPEGWLGPLIEWMDTHPDCGICGPLLHSLKKEDAAYVRSGSFEYAGAAGGYVDRFGYPFCRGRVMKLTESDEGQYGTPKDVLWVSGACLMVRSSLWRLMGGFDDRFFAHMEEIDYCWRAQLEGWKVTVVPDSVVCHIGGGTLPQSSPFKLKLNYRNNLLLLDNNLARTIGEAAAARRIAFRRFLDSGSAFVYLLTGRYACFKAVVDAGREYRALKRRPGKGGKKDVDGLEPVSILFQSAIRGKRIFNYLRRYEDSH